jgi:hypothetical protein
MVDDSSSCFFLTTTTTMMSSVEEGHYDYSSWLMTNQLLRASTPHPLPNSYTHSSSTPFKMRTESKKCRITACEAFPNVRRCDIHVSKLFCLSAKPHLPKTRTTCMRTPQLHNSTTLQSKTYLVPLIFLFRQRDHQ